MKARRNTSPVIALSVLLSGCDPTTILSGNFASWPEGAPPSEIPGSPEGDDVAIVQVSTPSGGYYPGGVGAGKFWFRDTACPLSQTCSHPARQMYFAAAPTSSAEVAGVHTLLWTGGFGLHNGGVFQLTLFQGHWMKRLEVQCRMTGGMTACGTVEPDGTLRALGNVSPGTKYSVAIMMDLHCLATQSCQTPGYTLVFEGNGSEIVINGTLSGQPDHARWGLGLAYINPTASHSSITLESLTWTVASN